MLLRISMAVVVLAASASFADDAAKPESKKLDAVVSLQTGDLAALQINTLFASGLAKEQFDGPVLAIYDRQSGKVIISLFGSRSNVEGARESLDGFLKVLGAMARPMLSKQYGAELTDDNTTVVYLGKVYEQGWKVKEIVRREGGKYITP